MNCVGIVDKMLDVEDDDPISRFSLDVIFEIGEDVSEVDDTPEDDT